LKINGKQHLRAWTNLRENKNKAPAMIGSQTLFRCFPYLDLMNGMQ